MRGESRSRGRVQYVDVVLAFAMLVSFAAMVPWLSQALVAGSNQVDPFSAVLMKLVLPVFLVSMLVSIGVSARR